MIDLVTDATAVVFTVAVLLMWLASLGYLVGHLVGRWLRRGGRAGLKSPAAQVTKPAEKEVQK